VAIGLSVAADLAPVVRIGALACDVARVLEQDAALDAPFAGAEAAIRVRGDVDVSAARALYRALGLDPTKTRPSSEALLRRIRRGEPLPRINTVVDLGNWCSVEVQLPYGLYDLEKVDGPVELRRGREDESYAGIRKDVVHLAGRLVLADRSGPFGNPSSDSARTMVGPGARRVLVVVYAPASFGTPAVSRILDLTSERMARWAGGCETWRWVS
jgi:DNA/RNA-binding domain of Phe-tRNA-synthetase-like protein